MQKEYPKFEIEQLSDYIGDNPFIKKLHNKYCIEGSIVLTPFENEYLIKNFRFCGYEFHRFTVQVGKLTEKRIQEDYNLNRAVPETQIDTIVAETDEWYHASCRTASGRIYFWLFKEEVGDLYEQVYTVNSKVDFEELNGQLIGKSLYEHQEKGVQYLVHQKKCFLYDTVGAGKTYTSIGGALAAKSRKVLIICLSGKKIDWRKELAVWGKEAKIINGWKGWIEDDIQFTIINFDIIHKYHEFGRTSKKKPKLYRPLLEENFDCIIVDEIQRIKNPKAKRSKAIAALTAGATKVYGLSATPIEKNEDFYNICRTLNISVGDVVQSASEYHYNQWFPKFEEFVTHYCHGYKVVPKNTKIPPFWIKGKKIDGKTVINSNTYELHQRIKHKQRRRTTEKVMVGFPEKSRERLWYDLNSKEEREYEILFENYVKAKIIMREADKILLAALRDIAKPMSASKLEKIKFKYISKFNLNKDRAIDFHEGYEKMVVTHADVLLGKLSKGMEKNIDRGLTEKQYEHYLKTLKPVTLEESRELIDTILLRQYLAIKKAPHTISQIEAEVEDGNNCLVFTHFIEEFNQIAAAFPKQAVLIKSGMTPEKKQAAIDEYMTNPKKTIIIGNIISFYR